MENGASVSLPAKAKRKPPENLQAIQADVVSFAASLGLAAGNSSGFDDSDFRKKGPIRKGDKSSEAKGSAQEKKKRKSGIGDDVSGNKSTKNAGAGSSKKGEVLTLNGKPGSNPSKGKKEREKGTRQETPIKGVKNVSKPESLKSKIHEVLDGAIPNVERTNGKKRKGRWNHLENEEAGPQKRSIVESDSSALQSLRAEAQQLMEKASQEYERSRQKDSDAQWLMTARRSGTSADKVAAMTVILQENPKANVRTLDALIGMLTSKAGKRHAATGIDALKELFMFSLLPDRKLKYFSQQPVATLSETKERTSQLLEWYWEDCLKHRYERFVLALEEATKDTLMFLKEKALKTVYELLKSKPEQERRLLAALVNKLGDPDRKMASNASYLLSCLLTAHPNMKKVVVDEVDAFVFRPHVGLRARYYAAVFLNQIVLSNKGDGPKLAKQLIDLYFSLFKAVTSLGEEEDHGKKKGDSRKIKGLGKVKSEEHRLEDFVMEIDSRLLSALLTGVNRALPYITAEDLDTVTQENSVLFRLVHSKNFNVAVQALMLLHQLLTRSQAVSDRFYRALYSVLLSEGLVKSSKAEMFLGLIFKALKSDIDSRRMSAFAKRLTQVASHQPPQFACGCLLLLSEILKARPNLWNLILQPEDNDDDIEHFEDVRDFIDDTVVEDKNEEVSRGLGDTEAVWPKKGSYDPRHRDPLYCNAHRACWWELTLLAGHAHPSVATMARTLLSGANVLYNGDPLRDLALGVFLERFAEKKPKAQKSKETATWHGSSLTMPSKMAGSISSRPIGEEFLSLAADEVAPEDVVFHKFYVSKSANKSRLKRKKRKELDEDDVTGMGEAEVFEGDDSEDEEVDALLEQDADLEIDGGDDSEEDPDSDNEAIALDETGDGDEDAVSDVEEFDDSDDEQADALLEAGLTMSSDKDEEAASLGKKRKKKGSSGGEVSKEAVLQEVEFDSDDLGLVSKNRNRKSKNKMPSVFGEAGLDVEDHFALPPKKGKGKSKSGKKPSVFQEANPGSEDEDIGALSKKVKDKNDLEDLKLARICCCADDLEDLEG